jgi:hypothetical protein
MATMTLELLEKAPFLKAMNLGHDIIFHRGSCAEAL